MVCQHLTWLREGASCCVEQWQKGCGSFFSFIPPPLDTLTVLSFIWTLYFWKAALFPTLPPHFEFSVMADLKGLSCSRLFEVKMTHFSLSSVTQIRPPHPPHDDSLVYLPLYQPPSFFHSSSWVSILLVIVWTKSSALLSCAFHLLHVLHYSLLLHLNEFYSERSAEITYRKCSW